MSSGREILRLEGVVKRYGRRTALEIDELSFSEGERVLLCGGNGSGKSTLIKVLAGIVPPERGRVWRAPDTRRHRLGLVPQEGGLYGELTVLDNLSLRRMLYGLGPSDDHLARRLRLLGLLPLLDRRVGTLSGGFQRLVAVASALQIEPHWVLLDEPFSGVDADRRRSLDELLRELEEHLRLLVVAEPRRRAYPAATRLVVLEKGRLACAGH